MRSSRRSQSRLDIPARAVLVGSAKCVVKKRRSIGSFDQRRRVERAVAKGVFYAKSLQIRMFELSASETAVLERLAIRHTAREERDATARANPAVEVPILAEVDEVRARVVVTHVAATAQRIQKHLATFLTLRVFDPNLLEVQLVEPSQAELKRARELGFLRRWRAEVDVGTARQILGKVLFDDAFQERE